MRLAIHGNCQAGALGDLFAQACPSWRIEAFQVHLMDLERDLAAYAAAICSADVILSQPVSEVYRGCEMLSHAWVKAHARPGAAFITFPVMYFQGDHPLQAGLAVGDRTFPGYMFETTNLLLVQGFLEGRPRDAVIAEMLDPNCLPRAGLAAAAEASLELLREREARARVDLPISGFIAAWHPHAQLFHTLNHPHRPVVARVANDALALLGSRARASYTGDDPLAFEHIPALPCQRMGGASDAVPRDWHFAQGDRFKLSTGEMLSQRDYFERAWALLESYDREGLGVAFSANAGRLERLLSSEAPAAGLPARLPRAGTDCDINHVISYGQSLSNGWQGLPPLSTVPRHDSLMLGESVRPANEGGAEWTPTGTPGFHPLRATAQDPGTGGFLSAEAMAALDADAASLGETILEGALEVWRGRQLDGGAAAPGTTRLLASACGAGAQSIENLSFKASPCLFDRLRDCVSLARRTAAAAGLSYGISALMFGQGEGNNWGAGGTDDRAAYRRMLEQLRRDFLREVVAGTARQTGSAPEIFLYQTGGAYSSVENNIPAAQLDVALAGQGFTLVGPVYPLTESSGGHLDGNGYRWLGAQFGKVMHEVVTLGRRFLPLHATAASVRGQQLEISFHVPVPPLVWENPIAGKARMEVPDLGFEIFDRFGPVGVESITFSSSFCVSIGLARRLGPEAMVRYAGKNRFGRGSLHDSDPTVAADVFEADASGTHPTLQGLVGRPYPLVNWCVAFTMPIVVPETDLLRTAPACAAPADPSLRPDPKWVDTPVVFEEVQDVAALGRVAGSHRITLFRAFEDAPGFALHPSRGLTEAIRRQHAFRWPAPDVCAYFLAGHRLSGLSFLTNDAGETFFRNDCLPAYAHPSIVGRLEASYLRHYFGGVMRADARVVQLDRPCAVPLHHHLIYGHFLLELVPRFFVLDVLRDLGVSFYVALPNNLPEYVRAFVSYLVPASEIVFYDPAVDVLRADHFIVPSAMQFDYHMHPFAAWAYEACKRKVLSGVAPLSAEARQRFRRIYLSRSRLETRSWHYLENEAAVEAALGTLGFHVAHPQTLSLVEQMQMYDAAEMMVSEYSSASHNALFSERGTKSLVMNYSSPIQSRVARLKRQHLAVLLPRDGTLRQDPTAGEEGRFSVDCDELVALCNDFLRTAP